MTTPQSHSPHLPTSRQLLTSLFNAISDIPLEKSNSRQVGDDINTSDDATRDINEAEEELNKRRRKFSSRRGQVEARGIKTEPGTTTTTTGNILKQVPPSHRHLFITLHVLFPGLVLPALDLLDRGLVGRVILGTGSSSSSSIPTKREQQQQQQQKREAIKKEEDEHQQRGTKKKKEQSVPRFYLVRSAQEKPTSRRRGRGQQWRRQHQRYEDDQEEDDHDMSGGNNNLFLGGSKAYIVRLEAWNCTCPAFAFTASFPIHPRSTGQDGNEQDDDDDDMRDTTGQERETTGDGAGIDQHHHQDSAEDEGERMDLDPPPAELDSDIIMQDGQPPLEAGNSQDTRDTLGWTFGGLTLEQGGGDCPPLCKHLLACLLAEKWNDALGQYVVERQVSKQEMAGIVAEI
ncbi:hypothetical protein QBC37DRAFT_417550 [Rhypophila decipiens]|uniref:SWIM-type domain-containing protein n=1 Tax=Rhypophila decipiens TaxID=261697 RepID=A0AAN6YCQ6_9PEZI|nr:hypothetical protein QBC37DRAFT_417550 [Rhypophila decipiens]